MTISNEETTMTRPPKEMVNMMILQRIDNLVNAMELLELKDDKNKQTGLPEIKSNTLALILLIKQPLERQIEKDNTLKVKSIKELRERIYDLDYDEKDDLYKIIDYILDFVYNKDVTKWDTKEGHNRKDIWGTKQRYLSGRE